MKLQQIRAVVAIAERGGFRAASRYLGIEQSALSRNIAELERSLNVKLFERQGRGTVLTPAGKRFASRAAAAMSELRRGREEVAQLAGEDSGTVVASMSSTANAKLLAAALKPFQERYPNVLLRILGGGYQRAVRGLRDGLVDIYVGPLPSAGVESTLMAEELYANPLAVIARADHSLNRSASLLELAEAEWMGARIEDMVEDVPAIFERYGLSPPRMRLEFETAWTLMVAVANSDILALLPEESARLMVAAGNNLTRIPVRETLEGPATALVQRRSFPLTPAAEYFCDMLRRAALPTEIPLDCSTVACFDQE